MAHFHGSIINGEEGPFKINFSFPNTFSLNAVILHFNTFQSKQTPDMHDAQHESDMGVCHVCHLFILDSVVDRG